ncbi:MBL fold metallo-hydrolase [Dehalococcoidia bacterium]|nr:MBL fold metallo-hydrolase [Dehalococcoidia bacterium]
MEIIAPNVHRLHINDTHAFHPGGTNIYFVGDPTDEMVLIDTGEQDRQWISQILEAYEGLGRPKVSGILISHGHQDHIGGLDRIHDVISAPVLCHPKLVKTLAPFLGKESVQPLRSRQRIAIGKTVMLESQYTPGHAEDHVCFFLRRQKIAFTGDTILGSSTSVVQDLFSYMKSLHTVQKFRPKIICPAHGKIVNDAPKWVAGYIEHRNMREQQVLAAVHQGITEVDDMVAAIYPKNLKKALRGAAAGNVRQHLSKLRKDGVVKEQATQYAPSL